MVSLRSIACLGVVVLPSVLADTTLTFKTCTTKLGTSSKASVGTTTYGVTVAKTATKRITVTPTVTIDRTASVIQSTTTLTSIVTEQTTTTSTVTVPTPAGFSPISGGAAKRAPTVMRIEQRENLVERGVAKCSSASLGLKGPTHQPALYPSTVTCAQLVKVVKTTTLTITAPATTTTASVPLSTNINTVYTTTTTTITVAAPAQTSYAACAANNFQPGIGGLGYTPPIPVDMIFTYYNIASQYDCCVLCQTTPNCAAGFFQSGYCELDTYQSCSPGSSIATVYVEAGGPAIAFNGPCGKYTVSSEFA